MNCNVYHTLFDECVTCKENFFHTKNMCKPYNVVNCASYSVISDLCLTCLEGHYNTYGNCLPYTAKNCATYYPDINYCKTCQSKMFYKLRIKRDLFKCKDVTEVDNCDLYQEYQDKCYNCITGYYLDESTNSCHEVPETVENCEEFIDADNCKSCVSPYYLENNVCIRSENEITKCIQYQSNTKCSKCEGASILSDDSTLCLQITEPSCETYLDGANCKTCSGNNVINYINDATNVITAGLNGEDISSSRSICNDSGIADCVMAKSSFPDNTCIKCDQNFFLSSSTCEPITQLIPNCETYFADGVCSQCQDNHLLSANKRQCILNVSFLTKNCQSGKFYSEPKCFQCRSGYYYTDEETCLPCKMQGCSVCSQNSPASCILCQKTYYMNENMQCIGNGSTTIARTVNKSVDTGILPSESIHHNETIQKIVNFLMIPLFVLLTISDIV